MTVISVLTSFAAVVANYRDILRRQLEYFQTRVSASRDRRL